MVFYSIMKNCTSSVCLQFYSEREDRCIPKFYYVLKFLHQSSVELKKVIWIRQWQTLKHAIIKFIKNFQIKMNNSHTNDEYVPTMKCPWNKLKFWLQAVQCRSKNHIKSKRVCFMFNVYLVSSCCYIGKLHSKLSLGLKW